MGRAKEEHMRKAAIIGTMIAAILVFGLMLVPIVGASGAAAPPLQTTETTVATEAATTVATEAATAAPTTGAATAVATPTTGATTAATATSTAPGALPRTGGDSSVGILMLGAAALFILGVAIATLLAGRRRAQP
jgi:LPXTG-motif cell wall-anchored protein